MKKGNQKEWKYRSVYMVLFFVGILLLTGCTSDSSSDEMNKLGVYYISKEYTTTIEMEYETTTNLAETEILLDELFVQLSLITNDLNVHMPLNSQIEIDNYTLTKEQLVIDFLPSYHELEPFEEILTRAAIVQTVSKLEGVEAVFFTIEGNPLLDSSEQVIGRMDENTFINSAGTQINSYEKASVPIYFTNEEGNGLLPVERTLVYSSNISREKLIVEQMIDGPANADSYPTIHPDTKINSVTVQDGVCYVDFSQEFLTQIEGVPAEITVYSLVNSLIEVSTTTKVQISIDGQTQGMYLGDFSLDALFSRNLEIIER